MNSLRKYIKALLLPNDFCIPLPSAIDTFNEGTFKYEFMDHMLQTSFLLRLSLLIENHKPDILTVLK